VRLLLDTHVVLAIIWRELDMRFPQWAAMINDAPSRAFISVASLWEIAIKTRADKLDPQIPLAQIEDYLVQLGFPILPISAAHAIARAQPEPTTRDPFDRLLVAIAQHERMHLVTIDRALADHPVTLRL
jgi:PIN domain nuclease of toxin-antitoxin system